MKEITTIIRTNKIQKTKKALVAAGYPAMTVKEVLGRGKQMGLQNEFCHDLPDPDIDDEDYQPQISFIPKRMVTLVAPDSDVEALVELIIKVNQTGNAGDGKVIISPISDVARVRTYERGADALV